MTGVGQSHIYIGFAKTIHACTRIHGIYTVSLAMTCSHIQPFTAYEYGLGQPCPSHSAGVANLPSKGLRSVATCMPPVRAIFTTLPALFSHPAHTCRNLRYLSQPACHQSALFSQPCLQIARVEVNHRFILLVLACVFSRVSFRHLRTCKPSRPLTTPFLVHFNVLVHCSYKELVKA
jgi:hypothetical protein